MFVSSLSFAIEQIALLILLRNNFALAKLISAELIICKNCMLILFELKLCYFHAQNSNLEIRKSKV